MSWATASGSVAQLARTAVAAAFIAMTRWVRPLRRMRSPHRRSPLPPAPTIPAPGRAVVPQCFGGPYVPATGPRTRAARPIDTDLFVEFARAARRRTRPGRGARRAMPTVRHAGEPGRPAAQQESGTAGDVDHPAVQRVGHGPPGDPVLDRCRVHPILAQVRVHPRHRDGDTPLGGVGERAALMAGEVGPDPLPQMFVVADGHGWYGTPTARNTNSGGTS